MKKLFTLLSVVVTLLTMTSLSPPQDGTMELKNEMIQMSYVDSFQNTKKELCSYYVNPTNTYNINSSISNLISKKETKLIFKTTYVVTLQLYGADGNYSPKCSTGVDTLIGSLNISMGKSSVTGLKSNFSSVKCKVRVIFTDRNKMSITFVGFTLIDSDVKSFKGGAESTETDLETIYKDFSSSSDRKRSDIAFFEDLKFIVNSCHEAIVSHLEKDIKINELD